MNTTWEYSTELFKPATVSRMTEHFRTLAESAASGSDRRLSKLTMLSESERAKVLVSWNSPAAQPATARHRQGSVRGAGRADAGRRGGRVRRASGSRSHELNRRANRIASLLREPRGWPGEAGRDPDAEVDRSRRGGAGGDEGRRRLHAARSDVSAGPARVHAGGRQARTS